MTAAERLRTEGRQEGRKEGLEKGEIAGMQCMVLQALEIRFGPISESITQKVRSIAGPKRLQDLLGTSIRSSSLEEFIESL